jgi:secondary thiamine-phosphate synthase enzyme
MGLCVSLYQAQPGRSLPLNTNQEPGLLKDIPRALDHIAPKGIDYKHHDTWHDDNGHSHVRASLLGPSITIPLQDGILIHGTWQQIAFIELDTQPRTRKIIVQIVGE